MAGWRSPKRDPTDKNPVGELFDGFLESLRGENVINGRDLSRFGEGVYNLVATTVNMFNNITEKSEVASKILEKHLSKPKRELNLESELEIYEEETETSDPSASSPEYEYENEENKQEDNETQHKSYEDEIEEKAELVQASSVPLTDCKPLQKDSVDTLKSMAKNLVGGILSDFKEKNVIDENYLRSLGTDIFNIAAATVSLFEDIDQKTEKTAKIFKNHFSKPQKQLSLIVLEEDTGPDESDESTGILKTCPRENFLKLRDKMAGKIYPIKEKNDRTRLALIICNTDFESLNRRGGADLDIKRMTMLLESLDYRVKVEKQLTAVEMQSVLKEFAGLPEHNSSDSTFLVFMSHGILEGICGTTHSEKQPDVLSYDTIFCIFNNLNCENLKDKPKVIIVQACRGENRGELYSLDSLGATANMLSRSAGMLRLDSVTVNHMEKDFIAFYSTTPHNASPRYEMEGSPFITQLVTCIQKYSWCSHLEEVFREVQRSFEKPNIRAQMPTMDRVSLSRYFYLFPGN